MEKTETTCKAACASQVNDSTDPTVGEHLDARIAHARAHLEKLCVLKAKAEATQMLNVPMSFMYNTVY